MKKNEPDTVNAIRNYLEVNGQIVVKVVHDGFSLRPASFAVVTYTADYET